MSAAGVTTERAGARAILRLDAGDRVRALVIVALAAFALASFMSGVAGALLASQVNHLYTFQFRTIDSVLLLAVVLMGGIYSIWGAIVAGAFMKLLPALLDNWGLPADLLTILFGVGIMQVLLTAPGGVVQQFPRDMAKLGGAIYRLLRRAAPVREATK